MYGSYGNQNKTQPQTQLNQNNKPQPSQMEYGQNQQGGNRPDELINYTIGMASAKLLDWKQTNPDGSPRKPSISLQLRTFNPQEKKSTFKTMDTTSLEAVVCLKMCLERLIGDLMANDFGK